MLSAKNHFNILLIGAGMWSEANHIPNILKLKKKYPQIKVGAICDIKNQQVAMAGQPNLERLLRQGQTTWVSALDESVTLAALDELHNSNPFNLIVIACNPEAHFTYAMWALENDVHIVCDKPLIASPGAASNVDSAKETFEKFDKLQTTYKTALQKNPLLTFSLVLRRRSLRPFRLIAERLSDVQKKYDAGVNHINIISNSGVFKYPSEVGKGGGAHDFTNGIGTLSHSSYHYIDLMSWYLTAAPGKISYIVPRLTNITRVGDYLEGELYAPLMAVNNHKLGGEVGVLPDSVKAAELDFAFNIGFYDSNNRLVGDANFISNYLSFSPRTRSYKEGISNPGQYIDGGRTSHLYVDVHQSGLQNLQLMKNDRAFGKSNIHVELRSHPKLTFDEKESLYFDDAYNEVKYSLADLFETVVVSIIEGRAVKNDMIPSILDDGLNNQIFSKFYELIAREFTGINSSNAEQDRITLR